MMAKAARSHAFAAYDWQVIAERWETLIAEQILGRTASVPTPLDAQTVVADTTVTDRGRSAEVPASVVADGVAAALARYGATVSSGDRR